MNVFKTKYIIYYITLMQDEENWFSKMVISTKVCINQF